MPFYTRDLSIVGFWYPRGGGFREPIPPIWRDDCIIIIIWGEGKCSPCLPRPSYETSVLTVGGLLLAPDS